MMGVLDRMADLDEQLEPFTCIEMILIAVVSDFDAAHQFHDEVRPACVRCSGLQDFGNIRMIHHRQRLSLGLESGDDAPRVHAQLDDFERDAASDRFLLLRPVNDPTAAFADFLQ